MRFFISALLCFLLLCGCSRIPQPEGYKYSTQHKMQAAHHWDVLALDVADQINKELIKDDLLNTPVYVKKTCGKDDAPCKPNETSQFDEGFNDLLVTQLVRYGVPTCTQPDREALVVNYKVQAIYHQADRRTVAPGVLTALGAGIAVLRNAPPEVVIVATGAALDLANTFYVQNGHYEIIITTSMVSMRKYLFRTSSIYYINDEDFWQYQSSSGGKAKEIKITNSDFPLRKTSQSPAPIQPAGSATKTLPEPIRDI